ncbi:MAG: nuclear transport factor 2 family protein [Pyrinomonadaceae bacterium]
MKNSILTIAILTLFSAAVNAQSSDAATLRKMLDEFLAGAGRNDAEVHDRFWADDLIYTRGTGQRVGKADIMTSVRSAPAAKPGDPVTVYSAEDVRIQLYGDAAVVAFRLVGTTTNASKTTAVRFFNTGVFVKRKGEWRVVAWQATRIPDPAETPR